MKLKKKLLIIYEPSLSKYSSKNILQISGYSYPIETKNSEAYFLNLTSCWGWGTWNDRWIKFSKFLNKKSEISSICEQIELNKKYEISV